MPWYANIYVSSPIEPIYLYLQLNSSLILTYYIFITLLPNLNIVYIFFSGVTIIFNVLPSRIYQLLFAYIIASNIIIELQKLLWKGKKYQNTRQKIPHRLKRICQGCPFIEVIICSKKNNKSWRWPTSQVKKPTINRAAKWILHSFADEGGYTPANVIKLLLRLWAYHILCHFEERQQVCSDCIYLRLLTWINKFSF